MIGKSIAHYTITEKIGQGGMGEVYRATDTKLKRDVALKVLPESFTQDPQRMARFTREAQVLASLNHPNIGAIHGLEEEDGIRALVLELIEGEDLSESIARGPIPLEKSLKIALQIAEALEAAHEKGIIHRDLKPANVKVTPEGQVKVLDFGLAKAMEKGPPGSDMTHSPTLTMQATQAGMILGTAAYMSPEQARGRRTDARSDIWAFGAILFEMLVGKRPFQGEDVTEILASVIKTEPDFGQLPASTPRALRRLLRRCLEKDRSNRLADVADAQLEIREALQPPEESEVQAVPVRAPSVWRQILMGVILVGLTALLTTQFWSPASPAESVGVMRLNIVAPEMFESNKRLPGFVISPDGRKIAYSASTSEGENQVFLRPIDGVTARALPGARGTQPFFSPDSRWVGFVVDSGTLMKVPIGGATPQTLATIPARSAVPDCSSCSAEYFGATWTGDDLIILGSSSGLFKVSAATGVPELITTIVDAPLNAGGGTENVHGLPSWVSGSNLVLFVKMGISRGRVVGSELAVVDLESGEVTGLGLSGTSPRYVPTGHIVFAAGDLMSPSTVMAAPFSVAKRKHLGNPVAVFEDLMTAGGVGLEAGISVYSVSNQGTLIYPRGISTRSVVWLDRFGRETPVAAPRGRYLYARISPDGTRATLTNRDAGEDVWIWDFARENPLRLTTDPGLDIYSVWTADSQHLLFASDRSGELEIYRRAATGSGTAEPLFTKTVGDVAPNSLSPDGQQLVLRVSGPNSFDLLLAPLEQKATPTPLLATDAQELNGEISTDGRWLAYQSDESGEVEVYVSPFPDIQSNRWKISTAGGQTPAWSADGKELFFVAPNGLMAVPVKTGPSFSPGKQELLFDGPYLLSGPGRNYDVSSDGQRFLMIKLASGPGELDSPPEIVVVLNWFEELKHLVPRN